MHLRFLASFWLIVRSIGNGYVWITSGFPRIAIFLFFLAFGTVLVGIAVGNLGGGFFWEIGVFSVGGFLILRFSFKARKLILEEEELRSKR